MVGPRALVYVESLLGVGHGVRAAAITRALLERGFKVTYVTGSHNSTAQDIAGAKLVQMPAVKAFDSNFSRLVDERGDEINESWRAQRRAALLAAYSASKPQVIMIEGYPFSRRQFQFELNPMLDAARGKAAMVCSVRDILVDKRDPKRIDEIVEIIRSKFDMVLVHGDQTLTDFGQTFPGSARIADKLRYTGYVSASNLVPSNNLSAGGEVLVSVGGGAVGYRLLRTALDVRVSGVLEDRTWRFLAGHNLSDQKMDDLEKRTKDLKRVIVERHRHDFRTLLSRCCVSISQGGYNTIVDIISARARAVVVPFSSDSETEQLQRARLLGERGLLTVVRDSDLTPNSLANAVVETAASPRPTPSTIALDGARQSADYISELVIARRKS